MKNKKWKEIYKECNSNKYCQITNVLRKYTIKSDVKNFMQSYGKISLIFAIIILILLCYTFRSNLIVVLYSSILLFFMFLMMILYSTYTISLQEDKLTIKINFQEIIISYDKLENIYLTQKKSRFFFIPVYYYSLKVSYFVTENKVSTYSFPVAMLDKTKLMELFKSFEVKAYKDNNK